MHAQIHAHTYSCTHMHTYTHTDKHMWTYAHTHTHTHTHIYTRMHKYMYMHAHTCMHLHAWTCICMYTRTQTHIHTNIHTHIHTSRWVTKSVRVWVKIIAAVIEVKGSTECLKHKIEIIICNDIQLYKIPQLGSHNYNHQHLVESMSMTNHYNLQLWIYIPPLQ